jgi:hypothetical protein
MEAIDLGGDVSFKFFFNLTALHILATLDGYVDLKRKILEVRNVFMFDEPLRHTQLG